MKSSQSLRLSLKFRLLAYLSAYFHPAQLSAFARSLIDYLCFHSLYQPPQVLLSILRFLFRPGFYALPSDLLRLDFASSFAFSSYG
jgi:hypothetical protein